MLRSIGMLLQFAGFQPVRTAGPRLQSAWTEVFLANHTLRIAFASFHLSLVNQRPHSNPCQHCSPDDRKREYVG